jgi:dTDP-D-glucose 4,6-dehydratase
VRPGFERVVLHLERAGQDSQYLLDSARIKTLGWAQKVYLKEGIERMINWVENHPELLTMDSTYWHKP